ncbi:hypothetical protein PR202_ga20657 [Eleusine coracana subsp. coracana]|uniref:Tyrosine N-monooxygenase n=1 Tax=Eleusine coracana subsp. coracana TaxID=191504 RepID=A0AAV5CZM5_ELECO|nr:hypothetical protein PR202_ga20657 [Eleusine coracana subsp. coracana]
MTAAMEVRAVVSLVHGTYFLPTAATPQLLLLAVMLVYFVRTMRPRQRSTCARPPLPPGPAPRPVVGNLPEMLLQKPAFRWIHRMMKDMGTDIACIKLGCVHVIPITCPKIAQEVLKKQDNNFMSRPVTFASKTFSHGYMDATLSPNGHQWRKMRRASPPRSSVPPDSSGFKISRARSSSIVDVRRVARHYCGNITRRLIFNNRYFGDPRPNGGPGQLEVEHMDAVFTALGVLYAFCISDYLPWLVGLDLDGHEKIIKKATETVSRLHGTIIDERWRQWKFGERQELEDFLDVLISLRDPQGNSALTMEEVTVLTLGIAIATVDNPSNAVEWALAEMVNNPELLAKAVEEIERVVGRERLVQESDIPRLNYLKACLRDAFRLHPVAPFNVPHVALEDTTVAGFHIPKGSHVLLSRIGLGRNPNVWEDPLRFNPDRHIATHDLKAEVALTENDLRFIFFSTGRRGCIAASLGTAMSVMLFGRLLQGFTWTKPASMAAIDLSEGKHNIFMAKPLLLHAEPRLPAHLYYQAT